MNANGASILVNPHPCGHIVYPYTDEVLVGQAVALFASAGLRGGEGVILIMSADHCESIKLRLQVEGLASDVYERSGQFVCVTAEDLLAKFVPNGVLEEGIFNQTIASLIDKVRASATTGRRQGTGFWRDGKPVAGKRPEGDCSTGRALEQSDRALSPFMHVRSP